VPDVTLLPTEAAAGPVLTYCDDATGSRVALTAAELGTWTARVANLLVEELGLEPGARAAVLLPPHWQTAAVVLGAWSVGVSVSFRGWATAGLPGADDGPYDVVFVAADRADSWLEDVPAAPHRFALFGAPRTPGYRSFLEAVSAQSARTPAYGLVDPAGPATVDGTSYGAWRRLADAVAESVDVRAGDRLLVDVVTHEHPVKWLLAPLSAGASVVLCTAVTDPAARAAAEGATRVLA
jgi:uncharacterized protein (TIGR03089 family)